jgi:gluconolactonase
MKTRTATIAALVGCVASALGVWKASAQAVSTLPETGGKVTAPGAKLAKVAGGYEFTEGPASDAAGNVFFTDQPNDRILKWNTAGKVSTFLAKSGRANGLCFDAVGNLWACADEKNELWRISPDGTHEVVAKNFAGKALNGPNDVWLSPRGGLYLSDPFYKRPYWNRPTDQGPPQESQGVLYLAPGARELRRVDADLKQANGIIGTADGKTLYVADIGASKTYAYDIAADGSLTNKRLFCNMGSDGMTIDDAGNVYLTGQGVTVFDKSGQQIEKIPVAEGWTSNVCFGTASKKSLFITAGKSLYRIDMQVRGIGSQ